MWIAVCVIGAWFGFANPLIQIPLLVLAFPLALCVLGLQADTPRSAFKSGYLAGALAYASCVYWVSIPVHDFGGIPWILAAPCPLLLGAYLGLYPGCFSLAVRFAKGRLPWPLLVIFCGCLWGSARISAGLDIYRISLVRTAGGFCSLDVRHSGTFHCRQLWPVRVLCFMRIADRTGNSIRDQPD